MATYSYATFADAKAALAQRLYDTSKSFWSDDELGVYIVEALRTWNAHTGYWRGDFTFPADSGGYGVGPYGAGGYGGVGSGTAVTWYDLTAVANTLRPLTVTDQALLQSIEYSLLEPQTVAYPLAWAGSAQFSIADVLTALQRRRDEVLGVTGCTISRSAVAALPGRTALLDNVLDLRRVAFLPIPPGVPSAMWQDDIWALQQFQSSYATQPGGTPSVYAISTEPTLSFDTDRPPNVPGQYELLTINAGQALSSVASSLLMMPDDWTWVLRWGALADLLGRESNAKDALRAKYCEGRYRQGLSLMAAAPALLALRCNNLPLQIQSVIDADHYQTTWEGQAATTPDTVVIAGMNLFALSPPASSNLLTLTATVVQNAPVPVAAGDFIQVGRDVYDTLIDYAQHLASLKMGGGEFLATAPLLDRFMQQAAIYASKLSEQGEFQKVLYGLSQREAQTNPRYSGDLDPAVAQ